MATLTKEQQQAMLKKAGIGEDVDVSFDEIDSFGNKESILEMFHSVANYNKMLNERITLINDSLTAAVPFTRENLYLFCAFTGSGKCFAKGTNILMHDGTVKAVEDVQIGDSVMGPDSLPRKVLTLANGQEMMYDVVPSRGEKYTVNASHILSLKVSSPHRSLKGLKKNDVLNISVSDYLKLSNSVKRCLKGYRTGVEFEEKQTSIGPYTVGVWLGEGKYQFAEPNTRIQPQYKINSVKNRYDLLAGLIDSCGSYKEKELFLRTGSKSLAKDVVFLARSLGLAASIIEDDSVSITGNLSSIPNQHGRNKNASTVEDVLTVDISVKEVGIGDYYGFSVDKDHLFLLGDFTVVHNSTVAANISYPLWKQGKKVLVISNEETKQDILFRIACLEKGYSFNEWKKGQMPQETQRECLLLFPEISKYVKILDVTWRDGLTTKIEGVKKALESIKGQGFSCALIDYYQLIKDSLRDRERTRYDVLNDLRIWLGQYIKGSEVPICLFVQLYSIGKKGGVKEVEARIKECSAIVEPATVILEIVPNFEDATTDFIIHKDRFGVAGTKITCPFERGRYLKQISEREMAERALSKLQHEVGSDKQR